MENANYMAIMAEQVERNPLLAIDYYRRAYLLSGNEEYCQLTTTILTSGGLSERAKNSVEYLAAGFRDHAARVALAARQAAATK